MYSKCQRLFRSPSMPCSVIRPILKRLERPQDRDLPIKNKRRRSLTPQGEEQMEAEEPVSALLLGQGGVGLGCTAMHCHTLGPPFKPFSAGFVAEGRMRGRGD